MSNDNFDALTYEEQTGWVIAFRYLRQELANHLAAGDDPCQDRGVDWPCDVADALSHAHNED